MFDAGTVINPYYWVDREGNRTVVDPLCVNVSGTESSDIDGVRTHFTEIEVTRTCGESFMFHGSAH